MQKGFVNIHMQVYKMDSLPVTPFIVIPRNKLNKGGTKC